jgi:ribonuclease P protein component
MVFYKPSLESLDCSRIGLSVSKKVGKAHRRNRLKRIIREFYRHSQIRTFPIDFMLVVSPRLDRHQIGEAHSEAQLLLSLEKLESFLKRCL